MTTSIGSCSYGPPEKVPHFKMGQKTESLNIEGHSDLASVA